MGRKQTEETKKKLSDAAKKRHAENPNHLKEISALGVAKIKENGFSDQHRANLSASTKRKWEEPEYRQNKINMLTGLTHTDETKAKLSKIMVENWKDESFRRERLPQSLAALEIARKTPLSDEVRAKLSEHAIGMWNDPVYRPILLGNSRRMMRILNERQVGENHPFYGKHISPEAKSKISEKIKLLWLNPKYRNAQIKSRIGRPHKYGILHTDESKRIISQKAKDRWADPEWRTWVMEIRKPLYENPQWKQRQSEAHKRNWQKPEYVAKVLNSLKMYPSSLEVLVEDALNKLCIKYEPQKVIDRAIIDFYLPEYNICLEVDGFYWHSKPERISKDRRRDYWLKSQGYPTVRLTEASIKENALESVKDALGL